MSEADLAVYDAAFVKLDKDKDGFISPQGKRDSDGINACSGGTRFVSRVLSAGKKF